MKLAHRLLIFSLALITGLLVAIVTIVDKQLQGRIIGERSAELGREAKLVAAQWRPGTSPEALAQEASMALGGRVTLIDNNGVIVGDADREGETSPRVGTRATGLDLTHAGVTAVGASVVENPADGRHEFYAAVQTPQGISRVAVSTASLYSIFDETRSELIVAGLIAAALAGLFSLLYARYVSAPVIQLRDLARNLSKQEFAETSRIDAPGEVGDLAESLQELSIRLANLEVIRRDFIANVSHELCSPLTIAGGFARTLVSEDPPLATRKQFARAILSNSIRMQRIVEDLLDLTRMESGGWVPRPQVTDLREIIAELCESLGPAATVKGVTLATEIGAGAEFLTVDKTAMRQTISNLTENAIRYTSRGTVTIFSQAETGGIWIGVRDTGEGIASHHLPRIFERFYRADPGRSREAGGTGLGLAIVKHMAEAHGGRVTAESRLGSGTTIRAFFPRSPKSRKATPASKPVYTPSGTQPSTMTPRPA